MKATVGSHVDKIAASVVLVALVLVLAPFARRASSAGAEEYFVGGERLELPKTFAVGVPQTGGYERTWESEPSVRRGMGADCPFRDGVEFGLVGLHARWASLAVRENGVYAPVRWDSIGYFLRRIENARQVEAVLSVLHMDPDGERLGAAKLRRIRDALASRPEGPSFKVHRADFDRAVPETVCFAKDGVWYAHFAVLEAANVVEYKYAFDAKNRIARVMHVMVEGKQRPGINDFYFGDDAREMEERCRHEYSHARAFLVAALHLSEWHKALADTDPASRRAALQSIARLGDVAQDTAPDVAKLLKDPDRSVRLEAENALGRIGPGAIPELRKALADPDMQVFHAAARAIGIIGPKAKDAAPELCRALRDSRADVRNEAVSALFGIGAAAVPELRKTLRDVNADAREAAAEALCYIGPKAKGALPDLRKAAQEDPEILVRLAAERALRAIEK